MRRIAVRWRLTAAFALVMAVVLAATGLFVYQRQATSLDQTIDRALRARAADVAALAQQSDTGLANSRAPGQRTGELGIAQLIDANGRVLDRTPGLSARPLLGHAAIDAARRGATAMLDVRLTGDQPVRLLAQPVRAQDQKLVVIVGQPLEQRNQALSDLGRVLLLGGPLALLLASAAGYMLIGAALRPVEESVRRERRFVSDASHELRTPLAVLRTELELLGRERPSGQALQRAVGSAIEETDRLSALAEDLLLLGRADDRQLTVDPARLSAAELLESAAARARRHPFTAGKEIRVDADADVAVLADRHRAAQAIDNLVTNALRYAHAHVGLSARTSGAFVELHVTDDGPGFPVGFLPHAWERFARADAARAEEGAGLGLAIVRAIAEGHGGSAHAANGPGGGADVWIALPRAPGSAPAEDRGGAQFTSGVASSEAL